MADAYNGAAELVKGMEQFTDTVRGDIAGAAGALSVKYTELLRSRSPVRQRASRSFYGIKYPPGSYARKWQNTHTDGLSSDACVKVRIYNKGNYQLTWLLEDGHDIVKHGVKVGYASPRKHIFDTEQEMRAEFNRDIDKILTENCGK